MKWSRTGFEELASKFNSLNSIKWDLVEKKQLTQMFNRSAKRGADGGGTPIDTGELRVSRNISNNEFGYSKSYAPHVEYGHRVVRNNKQVGYVPGQYFLRKNVEIQKPIFEKDLLNALKEA